MAASRSFVVFLEQINLEKYCENFDSHGYDTGFDLCLLEDKDLDSLNIVDPEDRAKILEAAVNLDIQLWLEHLGLERYLKDFKKEGINTVKDLKTREINDDLFDALNVNVPGHRNRIKWAATFLKWHNTPEHETRTVVVGYWGKPKGMEGDQQHDFLCVPGYLKSEKGENALSSDLIEFIVDSGSEVSVTVKEELITELKLEYMKNVESRGVHASADKPTYKGVLKLGNEELEVEVMPDRFSTVGGAVMQKFQHYIDGALHRWLKEDS